MKQCKICGLPLGKEPTTKGLEKHWKSHHNWHWESNKQKTAQEALLKNRIKRRLGVAVIYSMHRLLNEGANSIVDLRYKRNRYKISNICLIKIKK